jgi:molybdenum cofactor biosynthesis protein B
VATGQVSRAQVVTVSDRCFAGEMEDESGPALAALLQEAGFEVIGPVVVPDSRARIIDELLAATAAGLELVVTTGGTGLGPRDVTPQATSALLDYRVDGLAEEMRRAGREKTPLAMLSRSLAGVRERTLILNLPGSVRGATESLEAVLPALGHALQLLRGETAHT